MARSSLSLRKMLGSLACRTSCTSLTSSGMLLISICLGSFAICVTSFFDTLRRGISRLSCIISYPVVRLRHGGFWQTGNGGYLYRTTQNGSISIFGLDEGAVASCPAGTGLRIAGESEESEKSSAGENLRVCETGQGGISAIAKESLSIPKRAYFDRLITKPAHNRCDNGFTLYAG